MSDILKGNVSKEQFINTAFWFDQYEYSVDLLQALPFPWLKLLKEIIFNLFWSEEDSLEVSIFEKTIKSKLRESNESITFADVLFGRKAI